MRPKTLFNGIALFLATAASVSALVGCATTANVQANVAGLESGLTAAEHAAMAYIALPQCGTPAATTALCSTPEMVGNIKQADTIAFNAIKAAEASAQTGQSPDLTAATSALSALQSVLQGLPTAPSKP